MLVLQKDTFGYFLIDSQKLFNNYTIQWIESSPQVINPIMKRYAARKNHIQEREIIKNEESHLQSFLVCIRYAINSLKLSRNFNKNISFVLVWTVNMNWILLIFFPHPTPPLFIISKTPSIRQYSKYTA